MESAFKFEIMDFQLDDVLLAGTSHDLDEVVGHMRPTSTREAWEYTVEKVAVNAVMAGAKPEYFPVILALAATQTSSCTQWRGAVCDQTEGCG
jgi:hypothetical protein